MNNVSSEKFGGLESFGVAVAALGIIMALIGILPCEEDAFWYDWLVVFKNAGITAIIAGAVWFALALISRVLSGNGTER
ncbi:MAG: hypothetical protein R6V03_09520 [Kiritimatiellia bacterium]